MTITSKDSYVTRDPELNVILERIAERLDRLEGLRPELSEGLMHLGKEKELTTTTTPMIGAATGTSLAVTGAVTSSGGGIGYATGAGGTVTQITSRVTGVTLNKLCGKITMFSSAVLAQGVSTFTLTNSFIAATDFILIAHISTTNGGAWNFSVVASAGSAAITVRNVSAASITEATPLRFTIIKGATA
jgi:hypothetical protein